MPVETIPLPRVGRPRSKAAVSHTAILDAVQELLRESSVRELSMEAVARRAGVGKPTLYKWWPSKTALIFTMVQERLVSPIEAAEGTSAEATIRNRVRSLIVALEGELGKVLSELVADGQRNPRVWSELYEHLIRLRREALFSDIERGKRAGEFAVGADPDLLVDAIFGPIFYNLLLGVSPLTPLYGSRLIEQVLQGARPRTERAVTDQDVCR
jgi:AcrR family transcriptional regulator